MGDGLLTVAIHRSCVRVHGSKVRKGSYFMVSASVVSVRYSIRPLKLLSKA